MGALLSIEKDLVWRSEELNKHVTWMPFISKMSNAHYTRSDDVPDGQVCLTVGRESDC